MKSLETIFYPNNVILIKEADKLACGKKILEL